jgi:hypothetical protein
MLGALEGRYRLMRINHQVVVFDAADLAAESSFWAGVLDGTVDAEDDWHMVIVDGEPRVGVQLAPTTSRPTGPTGPAATDPPRLWVEDLTAAHEAGRCRWGRGSLPSGPEDL